MYQDGKVEFISAYLIIILLHRKIQEIFSIMWANKRKKNNNLYFYGIINIDLF